MILQKIRIYEPNLFIFANKVSETFFELSDFYDIFNNLTEASKKLLLFLYLKQNRNKEDILGRIGDLELADKHGKRFTDMIDTATKYENYELLTYILNRNNGDDYCLDQIEEEACRQGNIEMFRFTESYDTRRKQNDGECTRKRHPETLERCGPLSVPCLPLMNYFMSFEGYNVEFMISACQKGDLTLAKYFLKYGDFDLVKWFCIYGRVNIVKKLISQGYPYNAFECVSKTICLDLIKYFVEEKEVVPDLNSLISRAPDLEVLKYLKEKEILTRVLRSSLEEYDFMNMKEELMYIEENCEIVDDDEDGDDFGFGAFG